MTDLFKDGTFRPEDIQLRKDDEVTQKMLAVNQMNLLNMIAALAGDMGSAEAMATVEVTMVYTAYTMFSAETAEQLLDYLQVGQRLPPKDEEPPKPEDLN